MVREKLPNIKYKTKGLLKVPNIGIGNIIEGLVYFDKRKDIELATVIVIVVFTGLFYYAFIYPLNVLQDWWNLAIGYPVIFTSFFIIKITIMSGDVLFSGDAPKNKYALAFRRAWPTEHLKKKFPELTSEDVEYYWFEKLFNVWRAEGSPRFYIADRTVRYGWLCRFVYYIIQICKLYFFAGAVVIVVTKVLEYYSLIKLDPDPTLIQAAFLGLMLFLYSLVRLRNKVGHKLTGVWRLYEKVNCIHIRWIDENIRNIEDLQRGGKE